MIHRQPYPSSSDMITAGYKAPISTETTKTCMTVGVRPVTPHNIRKYRTSFHDAPGTRVVHPGLVDDVIKKKSERESLNPELQVFGMTSKDSHHITDVFNLQDKGPIRHLINSRAEEVYASKKMEPLGRSIVRGHVLPEITKDSNFAFGKDPKTEDPDAKELIYPATNYDDSHHKQYIRSHNAYHPGEQKSLEYNWPGINPKTYAFGMVDKERLGEGMGASYCLAPKRDPTLKPNIITNKRVEDKKMTSDRLGQCRNLGLGERKLSSDHVFGVTKALDTDWTAGDCITGSYSHKEQMPDSDLGCSTTSGWRNITTTDRAYGCPSVRCDISVPVLRSVADNQNYGDDPTAKGLIYPSRFISSGVSENDFMASRNSQDIRSIFENIGKTFSDEVFQSVYMSAAGMNMSPEGSVSVEEFRHAMNDYEDYIANNITKSEWA